MKNIFIEGLQGTGKSILLQSIFTNIPEYHVCREGDYSPIELAWCTWMTEKEYHAVLEKYSGIRNEIWNDLKFIQERKHSMILSRLFWKRSPEAWLWADASAEERFVYRYRTGEADG